MMTSISQLFIIIVLLGASVCSLSYYCSEFYDRVCISGW